AVHQGRLRQFTRALDPPGVMVCQHDLARARNQRDQTRPKSEATDDDDGREHPEDTSRLRHAKALTHSAVIEAWQMYGSASVCSGNNASGSLPTELGSAYGSPSDS